MADDTVAAEACRALGATTSHLDVYPGRDIALGQLAVLRALPVKGRRLVGPWCFLDRFGPLSFTEGVPMDVAPHPHMGLQTVSWLLDGEIAHLDSLGSEAVLRPGGVNVMTSGAAIAHAEQTPRDHTGRLNGVQLWTALPEVDRHRAPAFQQVPEVPRVELAGGLAQVFSGALSGATSPADHFSPLVGADLQVRRGARLTVPLVSGHEHALLVLDGHCALEGQPLEPFPETILMWWNFVARTLDEIRVARDDWEARRRFGEVPAYQGPRLVAPELMRLARPNPLS